MHAQGFSPLKKLNMEEKEKEQKRGEIRDRFWYTVDMRLKEMGKSKSWLAREIGVPAQSLLSATYLKSHINLFNLLKISNVLGCSVEEMLLGTKRTVRQVNEEDIKRAKDEANTNNFLGIMDLFQNLSQSSRKAVVIHIFSLMGISPEETLERLKKETEFKTGGGGVK